VLGELRRANSITFAISHWGPRACTLHREGTPREMKISAYLAHLSQPGVTELVLTSGERPMARVGGELIPFGNDPLLEDGLVSALFALGGSRYIDALAKADASWTARAEPVGTVSILAKKSGDKLEIRLSLLRAAKKAEDDPASSNPAKVAPAPASSTPRDMPPTPAKAPPASPARPPPRDDAQSAARTEARPMFRAEVREVRRDPRLESDPPPGGPSPSPRKDPKSEPQPFAPLGAHRKEAKSDPQPFPPAGPHRKEAKSEPEPVSSSRNDPRSSPEPVPPAATMADPRVSPAALPPPPLHEAKIEARAHARVDASFAPLHEPTMRSTGGPPRPPELDALLRAAVEMRASDLHLVNGRPPLYRVAFELTPKGEPLSDALIDKVVLSCVPARQRLALDTDGAVDFALDDPQHGRFRVNVSKQRTGFKVSLRIVPREVPTLASLRLPQAISQATHHHQGLIVITGPTGHGKTTTLAAIVDILNSERAHHVITVEDPIEFVHPRKKAIMSQREVGTDTASFLSALKGSLREDPDVIVVGELRDLETVRMAVSASETGHLVLGTMNTPNAAKAIERLIDLFPPSDQAQIRMTLAGGLRLVVGQRLVPSVDRRSLHAAVELLPGSTSLWALIRDNRTFQIPSLQQRGKALGIVRLDESLAELVRDGKVSLEVAKEVAEAPQELEALLVQKPVEQKKPEGLLGSLFGRKG